MRVRGARLCGLKGARVCAGIMQSWALQEEERVQEGEGCLSVRGARLRECVRSKVVRVERGKGRSGTEGNHRKTGREAERQTDRQGLQGVEGGNREGAAQEEPQEDSKR